MLPIYWEDQVASDATRLCARAVRSTTAAQNAPFWTHLNLARLTTVCP